MIGENLRIALRAIRANKLRSLLTTLGIIIGVAAVVGVVSIVQGLQHTITTMFESVGGTYIKVIPYADPNDPDAPARELRLTYEDGQAVMEQASALARFTPLYVQAARVTHKDRKDSATLLGVGEAFQEIANHWVGQGRFFSSLDLDRRAPVCLLGKDLAESLALGEQPIGQEVVVGAQTCLVVGVMEKKGQSLGENRDQMLLLPITTAQDWFGQAAISRVHLDFQAKSHDLVDLGKEQISAVLRQRHGIPEGKSDDFMVVLQREILEQTGKILGTVTWVVAAIVGISLMVGGIGIMNVMLVSVTERTREIGIRKAIGARRVDILVQFLMESLTLSLCGGAVGILLGAALGVLGAKLIPDFTQAHIAWWSVALAIGFSALTGVVFGTYPAAKAAALDPIDALRYE